MRTLIIFLLFITGCGDTQDESCTITRDTIRCPDGTTYNLEENNSCTIVSENDGSHTVQCPDGTQANFGPEISDIMSGGTYYGDFVVSDDLSKWILSHYTVVTGDLHIRVPDCDFTIVEVGNSLYLNGNQVENVSLTEIVDISYLYVIDTSIEEINIGNSNTTIHRDVSFSSNQSLRECYIQEWSNMVNIMGSLSSNENMECN